MDEFTPLDDQLDDEFDADAVAASVLDGSYFADDPVPAAKKKTTKRPTSPLTVGKPAAGKQDEELARAIQAGARELGIDPEDYATAMSYESGETFDPWQKGPVTKWGQHRGTIQYGEPQRKEFGVYKGQSAAEQITTSNVKYLKARGVKPGMTFEQIYAAINGGSANRNLSTRDVGTPRTIRDNINKANKEHRPKVRQRFGSYFGADETFDADAAAAEILKGIPGFDPSIAAGPVTETAITLEAQRQAARDPQSSRIGVLYTDGTTAPEIEVGEYDIRLSNGQILRADAIKLQEYIQATGTDLNDIRSGAADFTDLIGGKAEPTGEQYGTEGQIAVISYDEDGNELISSSVTDPASVPVEAALHKKQFPNRQIRTEVGTAEDVIAARQVEEPVVEEPTTGDAAFEEANAFLVSQGQKPLTPEEFNARANDDFGTTEVDSYQIRSGEQSGELEQVAPRRPQNSSAPQPKVAGKTGQGVYRSIGVDQTALRDAPDAEQYASQQAAYALAEELGVPRSIADQWLAKHDYNILASKPFTEYELSLAEEGKQTNISVLNSLAREFADFAGKGNEFVPNIEVGEFNEGAKVDKALDLMRNPDKLLMESEAEERIKKRIKDKDYSAQQWAAEIMGDPWNILLPPKMVYDAITKETVSEEWQGKEKDRLLAQHGSFKNAAIAERYYQDMNWAETAYRTAGQVVRSFAKNLVGGTGKSAAFLSQILEDAPGINTLLPDEAKIGVRNLTNAVDFFTHLITAPDLATAQKNMKWAGSDDISKQQLFAAMEEFDKTVGDDPVLKGRLLGDFGEAGGSALAFVALGAAAPSLGTSKFLGLTLDRSAALSGALMMAGPGYKEAKDSKLSESEAKFYGAVSAALGLTEAIGAGAGLIKILRGGAVKGTTNAVEKEVEKNLMAAILDASKQHGKRLVKKGFTEAKQEFGQEVFQTVAGGAVLEYLKDKDQDPSILQKLTNALNRLPKQIGSAIANEGLIALATGGLMGGATALAQQVAHGLVEEDVEQGVPVPVNPAILKDFSEKGRQEFFTAVDAELKRLVEDGSITPESAEKAASRAREIANMTSQKALIATVADKLGIASEQVEQGQDEAAPGDDVIPATRLGDFRVNRFVSKAAGSEGSVPEAGEAQEQAEGLYTLTDKAGSEFTVLEDRGEKGLLVQDAKGVQKVWPNRKFTAEQLEAFREGGLKSVPPDQGETRVVYRLGWANETDPSGRYVGDADRVAAHINKTEEGMKSAGDTLFAYRVPANELLWDKQNLGNAAILPEGSKAKLISQTPYADQYGTGKAKTGDEWSMFEVAGDHIRKAFKQEKQAPPTRFSTPKINTISQIKKGAIPEDPWAWFNKDVYDAAPAISTMVDPDKVVLTKSREKMDRDETAFGKKHELVRAYNHLLDQADGSPQGRKRDPIEVYKNEDGTFTVADGNATVQLAQMLGWKQVPAVITKKPIGTVAPVNEKIAQLSRDVLDEAEGSKHDYFRDVRQAAAVAGGFVPATIRQYLTKSIKSLNKKLALKSGAVPTDLIRSTIVIPKGSLADAEARAAKVVEAMGRLGYKVLKDEKGQPDVTNRFADPSPGYKDIAIKFVKDDSPAVHELQLLQPATFTAKTGIWVDPVKGQYRTTKRLAQHINYDKVKDLQDAIANDPFLTPRRVKDLLADIVEINAAMAKAYAASFAKDTGLRASDSSTYRPSETIEPSSLDSTGTPSESRNRIKASGDVLSEVVAKNLATDSLSSTERALKFFNDSDIYTSSSIVADEANNSKGLESQEAPGLKRVDPGTGGSALGVFTEPKVEKGRSAQKAVATITKHMSGSMTTPIKEATNAEIEDAFYRNALADLQHWIANYKDGYTSFYGDDVAKANEMLQAWAKEAHGRELAAEEVDLFHLLGSLSASGVEPREDSALATIMLDRYLRDGTISAKDPMRFRPEFVGGKPTGNIRFEADPDTGRSVVGTGRYSTKVNPEPLNAFSRVLAHFKGDLKKTMTWVNSPHPLQELLDVSGQPELPTHEYLDAKNGGKGVFSLFSGTGAKLGSYYLNRIGDLSTVTKDMWYGRGEARYLGLPLANKDGSAIGGPLESKTVYGRRARVAEDAAVARLAKQFKVEPAIIQQWLWDFEQRLWDHAGMPATRPSYISEGVTDGVKRLETRSAAGERAAATVGVGVVREGTGKTIKDTIAKFAQKAYKEALATNDRILKAFNVNTSGTAAKFTVLNLHQQQNTIGVWEGTSGSMEESVLYTLSGPDDLIKAFAVTASILAPNQQQAVMLDRYDRNGSGDETHITFKDRAAVERFIAGRDKYGAGNMSLHPTTETVILVHNPEYPVDLEGIARDYAEEITRAENRAVETDFIDESQYRQHLQEARDSVQRHYPGKRGESISAILTEAEARLREVKPELFEEAPLKSVPVTGAYSQVALKSVAPQAQTPLGTVVRSLFKTDKVMDVLLDSEAQSGPFDGGCLICAKGLIQAVGRGKLVRIVSNSNGGQTEHYGAEIDGLIYDADGSAPTPAAWIERFAAEERIKDRVLDFDRGYDDESEIPDDPRAVKDLAKQLRRDRRFDRAVDQLDESSLKSVAPLENSLGIPRSEMPQIVREDHAEFIEFAKDRGVTIKADTAKAGELLPTQNEYNPEQAAQLPPRAFEKRLMVSNDNRVLDGHNTLVRLQENPDQAVDIWRVDLPATEALGLMKDFPKVGYKMVGDVGPAATTTKGARLAPNGKLSNLNAFQWEQVRTPEFIEYFGDWLNDPENASQVVDENGEPKVLLHGSEASEIEEFQTGEDVGRLEPGIFLTDDAATADFFASKDLLPSIRGRYDQAAFDRALQTEYEEYGQESWMAQPTVYSVFVNMRKPKRGTKDEIDIIDATEDIGKAKSAGFDGLIVEGVNETGDSVGTTYVAFEPSQIKSAIGNNGNFDANDPSILKKARTTESKQLRMELELADTDEVIKRLSGGTLHANGELELNEADAEILRRLIAERYFQRTGEEVDEMPFDGIMWNSAYMRNLAQFGLTTGREQLVEAGFTEDQIAKADELMSKLIETADANDGHAIAYVYDEALPHERTHKEERSLGGVPKDIETKLLALPIAQTAGTAFDRAYPNISSSDKISELAAIIATGEAAKYGLSTDTAAQQEFLKVWANGIIDNNIAQIQAIGIAAWAEQYPIISGIAFATNQAASQGEQNAQNNENTEVGTAGDQEAAGTDPVPGAGVQGQAEGSPQGQAQAPTGQAAGSEQSEPSVSTDAEIAEATGRTITEVKTQNRKFAQSLANNLMDIGDVEYTPQTVQGWQDGAAETIEERGLDAAIDEYHKMPAGSSEGRKTALGVAIAVELYSEGRTAELTAFGTTLTENIGNAAQELRAAALLSRLSPAFAAITGDKIVRKAKGRTMDGQERNVIDKLARELEEAADAHAFSQAALAEAQGLNEKFEARVAELEKELAQARKAPSGNAVATEAALADALALADEYKRKLDAGKVKVKGPKALKELRTQIETERPGLVTMLQAQFPGTSLKLPAHHGTPHVFKAELLVEYPDGKREFIEGDVDTMPKVPKGSKVIKEFPHGRMKLNKVGTGEGHQAYGYGLYFASKDRIADWYRSQLSPGSYVTYDGEKAPGMRNSNDVHGGAVYLVATKILVDGMSPEQAIAETVKFAERRRDRAVEWLKEGPANTPEGERYEFEYDYENKTLDILAKMDPAKFQTKSGGARYNVDLRPSEDEYLDWDVTYSRQSKAVQKALGSPEELAKSLGGTIDAFDFSSGPVSGEDVMSWKGIPEAEQDKVWKGLKDYERAFGIKEYRAEHPDSIRAEVTIRGRKYVGTADTKQEAIAKAVDQMTGAEIYHALSAQAIRSLNYGKPSQEFASNWLLQRGIKGNRYLDGDSRHGGAGSSNFVIFSDKDIAIESVLKKVAIDNPSLYPSDAKRLNDAVVMDADGLGNLVKVMSSSSKGFRSLDIPSQDASLAGVFRLAQNLKVRDAIIRALSVNVMDLLGREQVAPQVLFHDPSVFRDLLSVDGNNPIPVLIDVASAAPAGGTRGRAVDAATLSSILRDRETGATGRANQVDPGSGPRGVVAESTAELRPLRVTRMALRDGVAAAAASVLAHKGSISQLADFNDRDVAIESVLKKVDPQTLTPEFKAFFKDSKVVDENGEPVKLYHGTQSGALFDVFEGDVTYLSSSPQFAGEFGELMDPIYASIKNPYDFSKQSDGYYHDAAGKLVQGLDGEPIGIGYLDAEPAIVDELRARGFDGAIDGEFEFVVSFDNRQLKSAVGNSGAFDPNEDSILKSVPVDLGIDPKAADALIKVAAAKLIDEVPTGLTPTQFDKWLNEITNNSLGVREIAVIHAMAHEMTRPAQRPQDLEQRSLTKNRLAHKQRADRILIAEGLTDVTPEGIAEYKEAHKKQGPKKGEAKWPWPKAGPKKPTTFAARVVSLGEDLGVDEQTVVMAAAQIVTPDEKRLRQIYNAKFPDGGAKGYAAAMNAGKQLADMAKDQLAAEKWQEKAGADATRKQVLDLEAAIKGQATEERLKRKALESQFKKLAATDTAKVLGVVSNIYNLPRSVMFSGDLGFLLAQGLPTLLMHPTAWWKAVTTGIPAALTDKRFEEAITTLYNTEERKRLEAGGTKFEQIGNVADFNDDFMSDAARHIPFVKQSNRAHSITTDLFRLYGGAADFAELDAMYEAGKLGKDADENAFNYNRSKEFLAQKWVNVMSGKGYLGIFDSLGKAMAQVGSAPRYTVSSFQIPYYANPIRAAFLPKGARKIMMKNSAKLWIPILAVMVLLSKLGLINDDPEDKDFLVIDAGKLLGIEDMKINPMRALKEPIRLTVGLPAKMLYYQMTGNSEGVARIAKSYYSAFIIDNYGGMGSFWKSKLHPTIGLGSMVVTGKNFVGEPAGWMDYAPLPLSIKETYQAAKYDRTESILKSGADKGTIQDNWRRVLASLISSSIGWGANSYPGSDTTIATKQLLSMMGPSNDDRTDLEKAQSQKANQIERLIREGVDVSEIMQAALSSNQITKKQAEALARTLADDLGDIEKRFGAKFTDEQKAVLMNNRKALKILDYLYSGTSLDWKKIDIALKLATPEENRLNGRQALAAAEAIVLEAMLRSDRITGSGVTTDDMVEMYKGLAPRMTVADRDAFMEKLEKKARNSNKSGNLTPEELEKVKEVIPDIGIVPRAPGTPGPVYQIQEIGSVEKALGRSSVKKWSTDDWVVVLQQAKLSPADKALAEEALKKKATNAKKSRTLTQAEVDRINSVLPGFKIEADSSRGTSTTKKDDRPTSKWDGQRQSENIIDNRED